MGRLTALALGQGDLHSGGQTVAQISMEGGKIMYKPHSLLIDEKLDGFLNDVFGSEKHRVKVPRVINRGSYGWAKFINHEYCDTEEELQDFYRRLGYWLAVLRLLGGTDIHLENMIAAGPIPVVIDVESLFALPPKISPSGLGDACDRAQALISGSVLRTGIVPIRTSALGFNNVDLSAAGALPGQQPQIRAPIIVNDGTMNARLEIVDVDVMQAKNHPNPQPDVSRYWNNVSDGFLEATTRLRAFDADGGLARLLMTFEGCRVRDVRRTTQAYVEIGRMLWHPASLHQESKAIERARDLLARNAEAVPTAPSLPEEITREIDDLRYGDVPIFVSTLTGDRIEAVLADWRSMRADVEDLTIRSALVATDLNQRMRNREEARTGHLYAARNPRTNQLDARRRNAAARAALQLIRLAVRGDDKSITWITPEIGHKGWVVQPVQPGLYFGIGGVVFALAGYLHEVKCGRANVIEECQVALEGAIQVMHAMEHAKKPETVGGFSGYGSQIWVWVTLYDLLDRSEMLTHAIKLAEELEREGFDNDQKFDIIDGSAGAIAALLCLAEATGDDRWHVLACTAAQHLEETAIVDEKGARWPLMDAGPPIGGFAHGATGIAWALSRLSLAGAGDEKSRARWHTLADSAFLFQESLYDDASGNWLDIRPGEEGESFPTWCHGSVGIGLAACDLFKRTRDHHHLDTLRRAVAQARGKWGSSHTLCHGDMSLRELLVRASTVDPGGCHADPSEATAQIVSAIEEHQGMVGGLTRAAFTPGLMTGLAGAVHGLCRMHPRCDLPSPLLLERNKPSAAALQPLRVEA